MAKVTAIKKANPASPRVVVVDADEERGQKMSAFLGRNGFESLTCREPLKAMALFRRKRPNAVVLEVIMPGLSGFEIAARMQAEPLLERTPIIFTSDIQNSAAGNHDYFPRPLNARRLVETLKSRISNER